MRHQKGVIQSYTAQRIFNCIAIQSPTFLRKISAISLRAVFSFVLICCLAEYSNAQCYYPVSMVTTSSGSEYTSTFTLNEAAKKNYSIDLTIQGLYQECVSLQNGQSTVEIEYNAPSGSEIVATYQSFERSASNPCGVIVCESGSCDENGACSNSSSQSLPISLVSFEAEPRSKGVLIKWKTASEINNSHFVVERSSDAVDWEPIASINGAVNSELSHTYEIVDFEVTAEKCYYRLVQFDLDGTSSIFPMVAVEFPVGNEVYIDFNSYSHTLQVNNAEDDGRLQVYDFHGQKIKEIEDLSGAGLIDLGLIVPGDYIVLYISNRHTKFKRIRFY